MSLQNRVNPYGEIVAIDSRGAWMGNRGCLHDSARRLTAARWVRKQWVICLLSFRGRHREVMSPGKYTELFFLDEATALAAGHRPCGTCRKDALARFISVWEARNAGRTGGLTELDATLHSQRAAVVGRDALPVMELSRIPEGCMVAGESRDDIYLVWDNRLFTWSFEGYTSGPMVPPSTKVRLITPLVTSEIIAHGYRPQVHPSAAHGVARQQEGPVREWREPVSPPSRERPRAAAPSTRRTAVAIENKEPEGKALYKLQETPGGRNLYAYFAAILEVTGMDRGNPYPLKKFLGNFSGHQNAGRIVSAGNGLFRLSDAGIAYFKDRFNPGNPQHITRAEVDRYKHGILNGGGRDWVRVA